MDPLQGADFDELQARLRASLAQKAGLAPADPSAAPPVADAGNPSPGSGPAAPQTSPANALGMNPDVMKHLVGLLGPEFSPDAYRQAQERDWDKTNRNQMMEGARQILAAQGNVPYQPRPTENNVEQTMLANRRQNILGTTEAAGKLQGMLLQQSLMDSNSPMSRMYQDQISKLDPDYVAKRYGGPQGLRNVPGFLIKQDMEARKELGATRESEAKGPNINADTALKIATAPGAAAESVTKQRSAEFVPLTEILDAEKQFGISIPNRITYGELQLRTDAALKKRDQDLAEVRSQREFEFNKQKWQAENPRSPAPGYVLEDGRAPTQKLKDEFPAKVAAAQGLVSKLQQYQDIHNRIAQKAKGGVIDWDRFVGPERAELDTLSGQIKAEIRNLIGAKTLTDSDIKLAEMMAPPATGIRGQVTRVDSINRAVDNLKQNAQEGLDREAAANYLRKTDPNDLTKTVPYSFERATDVKSRILQLSQQHPYASDKEIAEILKRERLATQHGVR